MSISQIHIVQEGSIPIFVFPYNSKNELVAMFCGAINTFGFEKFKSAIDNIRFNDGSTIFFKEFSIHSTKIQIFIVANTLKGDSRFIDQVSIKIKWLIDKYKLYSTRSLENREISQIAEEIEKTFKP